MTAVFSSGDFLAATGGGFAGPAPEREITEDIVHVGRHPHPSYRKRLSSSCPCAVWTTSGITTLLIDQS